MATNNKGKIIGVGRLHFVNTKESQIRYMAVDKNFRKKGVGIQLFRILKCIP